MRVSKNVYLYLLRVVRAVISETADWQFSFVTKKEFKFYKLEFLKDLCFATHFMSVEFHGSL